MCVAFHGYSKWLSIGRRLDFQYPLYGEAGGGETSLLCLMVTEEFLSYTFYIIGGGGRLGVGGAGGRGEDRGGG